MMISICSRWRALCRATGEILQVCINEILLKSNGYCKFCDHKMMYLAACKMVRGMRKLISFFDVEGGFQQLEEDLWRA